jgi:uncharacterized membrane protein YphA (DoxX/SURF4 family)
MERGDRGIQRVCHQVVGQSCWSTIEKKQRAIGHDRFQNDHEGPTGSAGIDLPARRDEPFSATHDEPPMPQAAILFHDALTARGWVFEIVVGMEIAAGMMLLTGRWVPFALVILAPIVVNIFCFHLFPAPGGLPVAVTLTGFESVLAWRYRAAFAPPPGRSRFA